MKVYCDQGVIHKGSVCILTTKKSSLLLFLDDFDKATQNLHVGSQLAVGVCEPRRLSVLQFFLRLL